MSDSPRLSDSLHQVHVGPARLLALPIAVPDVVSVRASFRAAPDFGSDDDLVQSLLVRLLDKGTNQKDRFEISEFIEGRGASVNFSSDDFRVSVRLRALKSDMPDLMRLAFEMLREPALDAEEIEKERVRTIARIRRSAESTRSQAATALSRRLFSFDHPNFVRKPEDELKLVGKITQDEVRTYHAGHSTPKEMFVTAVGDVDVEELTGALKESLAGWEPGGLEAHFSESAAPDQPGRSDVPMEDRANLDVRIGHPVTLRRTDDDYLAAAAGVFSLGGNFSSRLMQAIRDEMGLTYGISARLAGISTEHDGLFRVGVGLSQENLEKGIQAVREEVERWVSDGISGSELERTKTTLTGTHTVSLATTGGLADRLLANAERGFEADYIDTYPDEIRALTVDEVNEAITQHFQPETLHSAVAGTISSPVAT